MGLKSNVYEKLNNAVDKADEKTLEGVQIISMAASSIKNLTDGIDEIDDEIYELGEKGKIGFGVATALPSVWENAGVIPLSGHDSLLSENYGNYMHMKSGAIMVYIPKHYFKIDGNTFSYSTTPKSGYVLDRSFINGGEEQPGIFVSKYQATNNNGVLSSQQGKDPLSTKSTHNPIGDLLNTPTNNFGGCYSAVKGMDEKAFLTPIYVWSMLARMAKAHGEAATSTIACAFSDIEPRLPKGNNNNALGDVNDSSISFVESGYSSCALTGSGDVFAKTTHNGQECGVADMNGNMNEVVSGFIRTDEDGFLVLKEEIDITTLVDATSIDTTGAYYVGNYDVINISDFNNGEEDNLKFGNGTNQVFAFSTDRASSDYKRTAIMQPLANGASSSGTTEFGQDLANRYLRDNMSCLVGGYWGNSSDAGVFFVAVSNTSLTSNVSVGLRACIYAS